VKFKTGSSHTAVITTRPLQAVARSVCLFVSECLLVTYMSSVKTAEPTKMQFRVCIQVSQSNHKLGGAQIPQGKGAILGASLGPLGSIGNIWHETKLFISWHLPVLQQLVTMYTAHLFPLISLCLKCSNRLGISYTLLEIYGPGGK